MPTAIGSVAAGTGGRTNTYPSSARCSTLAPMATRTPRTGRPIESHEDNFWSKVQWPSEPDGCWQWTGTIDPFGYGEFVVNNKTIRRKDRAHRWSMDFAGQNTNPGNDIHHVCKNRSCVNPDHLEVLSRSDHARLHNAERREAGGRSV